MNSTMIDALLRQGTLWLLAASFGIAIIAVLRPLVRHHAGAGGVLALWWILPVALLAAAIPKHVEVEIVQDPVVMWEIGAPQAVPDTPHNSPAAVPSAPNSDSSLRDWRMLLLAAWLGGAMVLAAHITRAQWRYARTIDWRNGKHGTLPAEGVPAVVGVFMPRIALPADFRTRYSAAERRLILLHETFHQRRRDGLANFCMTLLRVILWFNPLVHWAARALGDDQESACDAAVIARHPNAVRMYAEALLRSYTRVSPLPLVCHWQAYHPTVKRIAMLKQHRLGKRGTLLSRTVLTFGALFAAAAVYALQPAREVQVVRDASTMTTEVGVQTESPLPFIQAARVEPMQPLPRQTPVQVPVQVQVAALTPPSGTVDILGPTATTDPDKLFFVSMDIKQEGGTMMSPNALTTNGRAIGISISGHPRQPNIDLRLVPTQQPDGDIEIDVELKLSAGDLRAAPPWQTSAFKLRVRPRERASFSVDSPIGSPLNWTLQVQPVPKQAMMMGTPATSIPIHEAFRCEGVNSTHLPRLMVLLGGDVSLQALSRDDAANVLRMLGSAPSNARIAQLLRDLSTSPDFARVSLLELRSAEGPVRNFQMEFGLKCPAPLATDSQAAPAGATTSRVGNLAITFNDVSVSALIGVLGDMTRRKVKGLDLLAGERLSVKRANVDVDRLMRATLSCYGYTLQESGGEWYAVRDAALVPASDPSACVAAGAPDEPKNPLVTATPAANPGQSTGSINMKESPVPTLINSLSFLMRRGKVKGLEPLAGERLAVKRANVNFDRLMQVALSCYGYALQESGGEWRAVRDAALVPTSDPSACVAAGAPDEPKHPLVTAAPADDPGEQFDLRLKVPLGGERSSSLAKRVIVGEVMQLPLNGELSLTCTLMRIARQPYLRCVDDLDGVPASGRKASVMAKVSFDQPGQARAVTRQGEYLIEFSAARVIDGGGRGG